MNNRKETAAAPISQIDYSDLTKAIAGVLSAAPMTSAKINAALGTDYTPLCRRWREMLVSRFMRDRY